MQCQKSSSRVRNFPILKLCAPIKRFENFTTQQGSLSPLQKLFRCFLEAVSSSMRSYTTSDGCSPCRSGSAIGVYSQTKDLHRH
jgi:hypothetical protein